MSCIRCDLKFEWPRRKEYWIKNKPSQRTQTIAWSSGTNLRSAMVYPKLSTSTVQSWSSIGKLARFMLHVAFIVSLKQEQYYEKLVISWDEDQMETGIK